MNESITASSFSVDDIGAEAVQLNTSAQRCNQEVLVGFEPRTCWLARECLNYY